MRSKTSWFDKTIFLKDLTRFAPLMGLYALCLLAGAALMASNDGVSFFYARNVMECLHLVMPVVNLFYAPVVATLLFGDLCAEPYQRRRNGRRQARRLDFRGLGGLPHEIGRASCRERV